MLAVPEGDCRENVFFRSPGAYTKEGGSSMKQGIHPDYKQTTITCACGEVIETGSTKENIQVEICSKCHPFFTGKQKLVDTGGRVEKFNRRFNRK